MPNGCNGSLCSCVVVGSARNTDWPPHHWKLHAEFEDGTEIFFTDPRQFRCLKLVDRPPNCEPLQSLGFDPLLSLPTVSELSDMLYGCSTKMKTLLFDQVHFLLSLTVWMKSLRICAMRKGHQKRDPKIMSISSSCTILCIPVSSAVGRGSKHGECSCSPYSVSHGLFARS